MSKTIEDLERDLVVIGGPLAPMLRARAHDIAEQPSETPYTALCRVLADDCFGVADRIGEEGEGRRG